MNSGSAFHSGKFFLIPFLAVFIVGAPLLSGCMGGTDEPGAETTIQTGVSLSFPEGYTYDADTGALYPPSGQNYASLPPYVTGITLIISGAGMVDQVYQVNLSTLAVTFTITPGIRTFTIIVTTSFGLTFTDSITVEVVSGSPLSLDFNLNINVPPSGVSVTASPMLAKPDDVIALSCSASDMDPGDILTYDWTGPGGWTATGPNATFTILNYGSFTFTCTVSDGWGGRTSASVTVNAPPPNVHPVVKSITLVNSTTKLPPSFVDAGMALDITCVAFDSDGDKLTFTLSDQFGVLANASSVKNYVAPDINGCPWPPAPGDWNITCAVTDGKSPLVSKTVTVQVWTPC
ncbi:MAG: PKD domain-containing protein [Nitrospinota bacterium]|nr:PKD domain-containing protein [Nitrospinota bacterium]